jgi:hypothetical protein
MTRHLDAEQLTQVATPVPMSREDKIERWASLIERHTTGLALFHLLERMGQSELDAMLIKDTPTAFGLAVADPVLREAGLTESTVGGCQRFFELSQADLHEFSCDCGGTIANNVMAVRLRGMASRGPAPARRRGLFADFLRSI